MVSKATSRFIRMSPQKARLVVGLIRGKNVNEALMTLKFTNKSATREIEKVVKSAVANARQKSENMDVDDLYIERAFINEGPRLTRILHAPLGRADRDERRTSHITIEPGGKELWDQRRILTDSGFESRNPGARDGSPNAITAVCCTKTCS